MADHLREGASGASVADDPIAIVGMAALFPGAGGLDQYWSNIVGGVDAIREAPPGRWDDEFHRPEAAAPPPPGTPRADRLYTRRGGFVDELATFDPTEFGIMPLAVEWAEPDQMLALRLAAEAIADGGGQDALGDRERVGVVLGRGGYFGPGFARIEQRVKTARQVAVTLREVLPDLPEEAIERVHAAFVAKLGPERPEAAIGLVPNLAASRIANRLDLRGPAYTVDAACASSLIAVDAGIRELRLGRADTMLVGGAHIVHEPTFWSTFAMLRALSPSQQIRPFDRTADGVLIGEGVGLLMLRRLSDAQSAGDRVYALIRGTGIASDGRTSSLMATASAGQTLAVRRAWADAGLDPRAPGAVGLIEAHGTATPNGDAAELATLGEVFGPLDPAAQVIGVGSVKSMIGHTMPAAGAAGLIKAALALHHRTLPPTLHCDDPHPAFAGTRFAPVLAATPWDEPAGGGPRRAGVNAFGFGGINAHAVLEQATDRPAPSPAATFPVPAARPAASAVSAAATPAGSPSPTVAGVAMAGATAARTATVAPAGLAADPGAEAVLLLAAATPAELAAQLDVPDEELLARDDAAAAPTGGPCRLALVAPTPRRLALARTIVARGTPWRGRNDLWFTPSPLLAGPGPAAAAQPAQAGKLAFLFCGLEDKFEPRIDDVCAHFGLPLPDLGQTGVLGGHGRASVEVGRVLDLVLRRLGIVPDVVGGHSVGEWNAMISSGMVPNDFVDAFIGGFDPASLEVPGVCFGAVGCGVEMVDEAIAGLPDVVVSHDNCPHQSVICGREASVTEALARLRARGVLGQVLPFRSGFHSPFLRPYLDIERSPLATMPLAAADMPIWSATTVAPYPDEPAAIRDLTVRHLLEPVRFRALTERLHDAGVRMFLQVGVGTIAGFVDDTLAGRPDHVTVVSNSPKRSGLDQLRRVAAAVWAEGGAPRLDLLPCRHRPAAAEPATTPAVATAAPAVPTGSAPAPRRGGRPMLLRLGSPMVRLGADAPALLADARPDEPAAAAPAARPAAGVAVPTARSGAATSHLPPAGAAAARSADADLLALAGAVAGRGSHPVLAEFGLAIAETAAVLADVQARWDGRTAGLPVPASTRALTSVPGALARAAAPSSAASPAPPVAAPAARDHRPALAGGNGAGSGSGQDAAGRTGARTSLAGGAGAGAGVAGGGTGSLGPITTTVRRTLSLAELPHVIDHCFYRQPPGWTDLSDRFPVMPMTAVLQMMIDEARAFQTSRLGESHPGGTPGDIVVAAVRDVRALRWVAIEPPVEVTISCTTLPDGAVRVSMDGYARVTVVFADAYPPAPTQTSSSADLLPHTSRPGFRTSQQTSQIAYLPDRLRRSSRDPVADPAGTPGFADPAGTPEPTGVPGPLPGETPSPHQAAELYGGRWMFHGPSYQGITHVDGIAPLGARGQLVVTGAPGALLDTIGQLYGYWATQHLDVDSLLLPQAVTEMRFYGPDPGPGEQMSCVVRIRDIAAKTVTADLEVRAADGTVWAEVTGWTDRRFTANAWLWLLMRDPERNTVAEPRPDGWVVVPDYWRDIASRELVVRHFLDAERRRVLAGKNPRAARQWLLGRIAAQDAVRRWLWTRGAGPVWGIEVGIDNDPAGRPFVARLPERAGIPADPPPNLSIAHKVDLAVAMVDTEGDVGIDLETVAPRTPGALAAGLTASERRLLTELTSGAGDPASAGGLASYTADADHDADGADDGTGDDAHTGTGARAETGDRTVSLQAGTAAAADDADESVQVGRAAWFARMWAAKEAVAKADGTGLQGRPRRYVVDRVIPVGAGSTDTDTDLAVETSLDAGLLDRTVLGPEQAMADGIKSPPPRPVEASAAEPPLLLHVTVLTESGPAHQRWVALRTVDSMGRVRRETGGADPVRIGDHIVAWTSLSVERAARVRHPRDPATPSTSSRPSEDDPVVSDRTPEVGVRPREVSPLSRRGSSPISEADQRGSLRSEAPSTSDEGAHTT
ncbi:MULTISPECIES: type I polyketide synthase [unclassified Pseudofrankia]|uniref:type I polyketide synthase n=1 Tax=unclassified Pseudofrankia TaxID=2994372 RepID=UPI0009F54D79|nr:MULTISPECIES: type I polyketide synthase [unclassified Pseudofrankia]MDT3440035.1 type I polyketide synthase [Pseudofrankia sp. BMG5.37]